MNGEELQLLMPGAHGEPTVSIACRFQKPEAGKPAFVWFCGFKSEMGSVKASALAEWTAANGAGCLRFDYSGHGKSGGRFEEGTISAWLGQAAAVCAHALRGTPAVFVGSSMGGWIALLLARQLGQVPPLQVPPHSVSLPEGREDARTLAAGSSGVPSPLGEKDRMRGDSRIQPQRHRPYRAGVGHDAAVLGSRRARGSRGHPARRRLLPPLRLWRRAYRHHQGYDRRRRTPPVRRRPHRALRARPHPSRLPGPRYPLATLADPARPRSPAPIRGSRS